MNERRVGVKPCEQPGCATVEDGLVLLDGPDGLAITMTADAAARTAESLRQAAVQAQQQSASSALQPGESKHEE